MRCSRHQHVNVLSVGVGKWALVVFTLFSFPVTLRAYSTGYCTALKRTDLLVRSAAARFGAVAFGCLVYPSLVRASVSGVALGVSALLSGFSAEAVVAAQAAYGLWRSLKTTSPPPTSPS